MLREQFRVQETWAAGRRVPIDANFVHAAFKNFKKPVIESLALRLTGQVVTASGGAVEAFAACKLLGQRFKISDERGDRIECSMRGLRIVAQHELGDCFLDPAAQAASTTNASYEVIVPITFHPRRADRSNDYLMTVDEFVDCDVIWTAATANPLGDASATISSATLELQANVRENYTVDAPSRLQIIEVSAEKREEIFTIDGALRYADLYADAGGHDLTSLSTYTEIDSRTLRLSDMPASALRQGYRESHFSLDGTNDEVVRSRVIPLVYPDFDQHQSQLVEHANKMHVNLQAALPTGGTLLTVSVTDRDDAQVAKMLGYASTGAFYAAAERGEIGVIGAKGVKPANTVPPGMLRKFPLRRLGV